MKESIEVLVREDGVVIGSPFVEGEGDFVPRPVKELASRLSRYAGSKSHVSSEVVFYLSEDILFFKAFTLPLKTPDIKEAVGFQLSMLAPFDGEILHSFTAARSKDGYRICLYAVAADPVGQYLDEAASAGFQLMGMFPESQRYVTASVKKQQWALLLAGRFAKLLVFSGESISDRLLCHSEPTREGLVSLSKRERIYSSSPYGEEYTDSAPLLAEKPLHKEFNLLPSSYFRPDYLRYLLLALCALNILALLAVGAIKEYKVITLLDKMEAKIEAILPAVKEVEQLRVAEKELAASIERIDGIGNNFDIIRFLDKTTTELPENCYLDQIRMDQKTGSIHLQGYTEDLAQLTEKLDSLDQAKLKSTRRRQNKTYFHVEISRQ